MRAPRKTNATYIAERAILSGLLRGPDSFWLVCEQLKPEHFQTRIHQQIYAAISEVLYANRKLSVQAVAAKLPDETEDGIEAEAVLHVLIADDDAGNPLDFVADVVEAHGRRQLLLLADRIRKEAESDKPVADIAAGLEARALDLIHEGSTKRPRPLVEFMQSAITKAKMPENLTARFDTGLQSLDEIVGRFVPGDFVVLMAAQGDGKTAMGAQIAARAAEYMPALYFQIEMPGEQMGVREIAYAADVKAREVLEGTWDFAGQERAMEVLKQYAHLPLLVHDQGRIRFSEIRSHAIAMKRSRGLGMFVVDHLQLIQADHGVKYQSKFDKIDDHCDRLKGLAKELDCVCLALCQRTRGGQRDDDPTPKILDAPSNGVELTADIMIGLWRKVTWLAQRRPKGGKNASEEMEKWEQEMARCRDLAELVSLKHRRMAPFQQRAIIYDAPRTRFMERQG